MESEGSLSCSQESATGPYTKSDESSPRLHVAFVQDQFQYYPPNYDSSDFSTKILWAIPISPMRATCHANLILFYLITRIITVDKLCGCHNVIPFSFLVSQVQIFTSAPCYYTLNLSMLVFWVVTPYILVVGRYQTYCTVSTLRAEDGDSMFLRNVGIYLQVCTALQHRRPTSTLHRRENFKSHELNMRSSFGVRDQVSHPVSLLFVIFLAETLDNPVRITLLQSCSYQCFIQLLSTSSMQCAQLAFSIVSTFSVYAANIMTGYTRVPSKYLHYKQ
jgi:hypothetical protein